MNNQYRIFTEVAPFYQDMLETLQNAEEKISMLYFTYDSGEWTKKMNKTLFKKTANGVEVRIMVDLVGEFSDNPQNIFRNRAQIAEMKQHGIQFDFFQAGSHSELSAVDRLHFKLCAIDEDVVYIGGSNLGDHYTTWQDTNLRVEGEIGEVGHQLYEFVLGHSDSTVDIPNIDLDNLWFGDAQVFLTVPGMRKDIANEWLNLIKSSTSMVYFRNWYFLPNDDFMKAMLNRLEMGVGIEVLLSHQTRVPVIDVANHKQSRTLVKAGANIHRYQKRYMHSKVTWNAKNELLFGSANLEEKALSGNFELCVRFNNPEICAILTRAFQRDTFYSAHQTLQVVRQRPLFKRAASYVCALATPLL